MAALGRKRQTTYADCTIYTAVLPDMAKAALAGGNSDFSPFLVRTRRLELPRPITVTSPSS